MGYLVIKNGTNKKSYQLTNTCNKPRLRVSNSYVPITNSTKPTMRARVNGSYIADHKSYTYTGNQGTQTTGTTYLTRSSTSNTIYLTANSKSPVATTAYTYDTYQLYGNNDYTTDVSYNANTVSGFYPAVSVNARYNGLYANLQGFNNEFILTMTSGTLNSSGIKINNKTFDIESSFSYYITMMTSKITSGYEFYGYEAVIKYVLSFPNSYNTITYVRHTSTIATSVYTRTVVTTGTSYQTRSSTSGTSYGTKTTNKTLTSSSWG